MRGDAAPCGNTRRRWDCPGVDGSEVIKGLVDTGDQACGRNVVAEDPSIHYLGEKGSLGNEFLQEMRNIFLPIRHEGLFISRASAKGNYHCLLTCAHGQGTQGAERRQHGRGRRPGSSANEFASAPRDRTCDSSAEDPESRLTREFSGLSNPGIVIVIKAVHWFTIPGRKASPESLPVYFAWVALGLSSTFSASASSCLICLSMARCSSASCFW